MKDTLSWSQAFSNIHEEQCVSAHTCTSVLEDFPNSNTLLGTLLEEEGRASKRYQVVAKLPSRGLVALGHGGMNG